MSAACIALAGNPNCGKSSLFNACTGARQHVGNYPGVTVDKKEGTALVDGERIRLVDLPGAYGLNAYSEEERVTRAVLAPEEASARPQAVIAIVDAAALDRHLGLAVQIMEMGLPVVLACNMMDEAVRAGVQVDLALLAQRLGVPVVPTVARRGEGVEPLLRAALAQSRTPRPALRLDYGQAVEAALEGMERRVAEEADLAARFAPRWFALKFLEDDADVVREAQKRPALLAALNAARSALPEDLEAHIAATRRSWIQQRIDGVVRQAEGARDRLAFSDSLDRVLLHPLAGPAILLAVIYALFHLTFTLGSYPQGWVEDGMGALGTFLADHLSEGLARSLLVDGVVDGVGGVLSFVPLIALMFLFIAFLEDSGYMARMAFMLDRVFRAFGLQGASVMPYIISGGIAGGCAIPGVMATRTLRSRKEKLATLLTLPYMACGAKLPVFLLLAGVFFPGSEALVLFLLTLTGWFIALVVARALRSLWIRGASAPLMMELPPYRLPTLRNLLLHAWERTSGYLKKAGTVLVAVSVLIWASMTFPALDPERAAPLEQAVSVAQSDVDHLAADHPAREAAETRLAEAEAALSGESLRYSVAGRLGTAIEPFTLPAGFDWRTDIALLAGIAAKEAIVSTLGTAYALGEQDPEDAAPLGERLAAEPEWSKATALALMIFVLLYAPCFVALVVIRQEAGNWGWVAFSLVFNTAFAFGLSVAAYQLGLRIWT